MAVGRGLVVGLESKQVIRYINKGVQEDIMRHGAAGRRSRNRGHGNRGRGGQGGGHGNNRMQVFDSNGPEVRIRGTAYQILEKYTVLAKDAASVGDRILAESYLQHAEHYQRIINSWQDSYAPRPSVTQESAAPAETTASGDELGLPASIISAGRQEAPAELETV